MADPLCTSDQLCCRVRLQQQPLPQLQPNPQLSTPLGMDMLAPAATAIRALQLLKPSLHELIQVLLSPSMHLT